MPYITRQEEKSKVLHYLPEKHSRNVASATSVGLLTKMMLMLSRGQRALQAKLCSDSQLTRTVRRVTKFAQKLGLPGKK